MIFDSSEKKFQELYNQYHSMVRAVLYNMTGEAFLQDLIQEAFLKIWKGLPQFDFRSSIKTWVYRVTVNVALDHLRRAPFLAHKIITDAEAASPSLETRLLHSEEQKILQAALLEISADDRGLLVLFYFEDLNVDEISKILKIPSGTVKSRLHTARQRLRDLLSQKGVHYGPE